MKKKNLLMLLLLIFIISSVIGIKIYKDTQKEQDYVYWCESTFKQEGIEELDKNGLRNYLGDAGIKTLTETFNHVNKKRIHSAPLNEAQKYLLGESDKSLIDLNPKEVSDAFTLLVEVKPKGTYSLDNFVRWLKDKT